MTSPRGEQVKRVPRDPSSAPARAARSGPQRAARVDAPARVAILGRPNVGKSTLFNALLGRRRAITHSTPGVTRDPVEAECAMGGNRVLLIDTGGYSTAGSELDSAVRARSLKMARESDLVLLVLDAAETSPLDNEFITHHAAILLQAAPGGEQGGYP